MREHEWEEDYDYEESDEVDYDYDEDDQVDYERHVPIDQAWQREPPVSIKDTLVGFASSPLLRLVLRVVGISLIVVNIILFLTPAGVFPGFGVLGPPVDIVRERSGLRCDGYSSCNYEVYVINRSDKEQRIVALVKSSVDYSPCRSAPIALGPFEETVVNIGPSVQPSMSTNPSAAIDALARWDYVGVEYAEGALPSGSAQAFGAHMIVQVIALAVGLALLVAAQRIRD